MKEFFENLPSTIGQILVLIAVVVFCPEVLMVIPIIFLSIVFLGFMSQASLMETREMLATIIADVTGKTLEEIYEVTKEDTFYNASKAVEFGLATGIIGSKADSAGKNERSN